MNPKLPWIILILLILTLLFPLTLFTLRSLGEGGQPTGSYLNPLPRSERAAGLRSGRSLTFYLGTAQESLAKARQLANGNSHQTEADKQQIIQALNQALHSANQAVAAYPRDPRSYQQRAEILFSVAHLNPQAQTLAEQDLATAQGLAGGQNSLKIENWNLKIDPIEALPLEQANLAQNLVIAAPSVSTSGVDMPFTPEVKSNVTKGTVVLPAGQTELKIKNEKLKIDSVIYLIPQSSTHNHPLYVKSKTSASFVLAIDQSLDSDLTIDYWIINQDN